MRKIYKAHKIYILPILAAIIMLASCKTERVLPVTESVKDISGSWQVIRATRNGTDLTNIIDFSKFRVNFKDGAYTLVDRLPFLVNKDGAYTLDDPQYPFKITFIATGAQPVATAFTFPIVNGKRQLSLTFSPGCPNNSYVYVLQKTN
ncbi:protein of unknown function [Mucilaginibacter pineti]|uniref:DUF5004 domain-containing protein n=1 Tax=Mucilaginibacter pineti TaxID=1391627 RepID=A0A1G7KLW0_9SPHI|nr:DUF5004 domain-containing protein [Mucilaginibacter pineti]SDF38187.1 protein of unknown function [Mucilaginibacter pineti]